MIHVVSVAELVDQDVINQLTGEFHKRDIKANCTCATAAAPSSARMAEANTLVG